MIGHGTKETQHHNVWRVLTAITRLASVEQHGPWREDDGIGHEIDGLPGRKPARAAERQLEAVPDKPEEQHVDVRQVIPHRFWRSFNSAPLALGAWWESAGSASLIFFRIPMISPPLV